MDLIKELREEVSKARAEAAAARAEQQTMNIQLLATIHEQQQTIAALVSRGAHSTASGGIMIASETDEKRDGMHAVSTSPAKTATMPAPKPVNRGRSSSVSLSTSTARQATLSFAPAPATPTSAPATPATTASPLAISAPTTPVHAAQPLPGSSPIQPMGAGDDTATTTTTDTDTDSATRTPHRKEGAGRSGRTKRLQEDYPSLSPVTFAPGYTPSGNKPSSARNIAGSSKRAYVPSRGASSTDTGSDTDMEHTQHIPAASSGKTTHARQAKPKV